MPYFDFSPVITPKRSSGASFLDKSMKKELYGLGYGHTKPAKISMGKSTFSVQGNTMLTRTTIFH